MSKMITLLPIFAMIYLASAAPYQSEGDGYHQAVDYQGQGEGQHHVIDFQQHLQQTQPQEFQSHQHQPVQTFQHQPVQTFQHQGFNQDVNHGIGQSQVHNTQGNAKILNYQLDTDEHNNYQFAYETDNGIRAQEVGSNTGDGVKMQGAYSYTGDDGQVYTVTYTADENGFHPSGAHLPTPPPIPEAIERSIQKNLQDEANGINDDGQYYQHQQTEQYTQESEQRPQISIAPKKYRPKVQLKEKKQQQSEVQQPQLQIVFQQPRFKNKPQQGLNQIVQQTQHHNVQQTQQKAVQQLQHQQVTVQRPKHISFNSQQPLQLQGHKPVKQVVKQSLIPQHRPTTNHQQFSQASLHQQNVYSSHQLQGGFVPKYEVKEHQYEVHEPEVQKQQIIEYHLPASAAQDVVTEERHKVEYVVPMKQFLEQFKPNKERQVVYQVPAQAYNQHKLAQDYIGPAPVANYQYQ